MLKPRFNQNDVRKNFIKKIQAIDTVMIRQLQVLGEKCINQARSLNTYQDDTGNLRSSIGYVIYANRRPVHENFENFSAGSSGELGKVRGMNIARKHASKYITNYYALVIVAGMEYAEAVEALGYDVLTSAEHLAEREFPTLMRRLMDKIDKAA